MRVLIVLDNIHTGGISKSLLNFLPFISKYAECDMLVFKRTDFKEISIPKNVKIVNTNERLNVLGMSQSEMMRYSKRGAVLRTFLVILSRLINGNFSRKILFSSMKQLGQYDLAISYSQDVGWNTISTGCNQFVLEKVNAKKKIAYVHCDYEKFGGYDSRQEKEYGKFDKIVCVSNGCKNSFVRMFPKLENKCYVCENFININEINEKISHGCINYNKEHINFVTVCRLSEEKGIIRTIDILERLKKEQNSQFKWTIVGDGPDKVKINQLINEKGLSNDIDLVGKKNNPFVYIKNADFFLLPSFHEAAPMVYGEAISLGVPVVTTNTISAKELIEERDYGIVCENSEEGIYSTLKNIFDGNIKLRKMKIKNNEINKFASEELKELIYWAKK